MAIYKDRTRKWLCTLLVFNKDQATLFLNIKSKAILLSPWSVGSLRLIKGLWVQYIGIATDEPLSKQLAISGPGPLYHGWPPMACAGKLCTLNVTVWANKSYQIILLFLPTSDPVFLATIRSILILSVVSVHQYRVLKPAGCLNLFSDEWMNSLNVTVQILVTKKRRIWLFRSVLVLQCGECFPDTSSQGCDNISCHSDG